MPSLGVRSPWDKALELTVLIYKLCLRGSARGVKTVVTVGIAVELLVLAVAICRLA